jgi:hypothetical protein
VPLILGRIGRFCFALVLVLAIFGLGFWLTFAGGPARGTIFTALAVWFAELFVCFGSLGAARRDRMQRELLEATRRTAAALERQERRG